MRELERFVILQVVDIRWREHLENMDYLREGVHLRAMAQKDPLVEYTAEGHAMFDELGRLIREEVVLTLFHAELTPEDADEVLQQEAPTGNGGLSYEHESLAGADAIAAAGGGATATAAVAGGASALDDAGRQGRARRHRPQRPLLVRQRQEVQEVPRRLTGAKGS